MPDPAIATAADYADAMISARRAKNVLVLVLLLLLLAQLALFFLARFEVISLTVQATATTQPDTRGLGLLPQYLVGLTAFGGVTLTVVLGFVLLLVVNIMLVGRLIGAGRLTSAYIWCLVLLVLLFPWQSFLNDVGLTPDKATWKIPGVLYTWQELTDAELGAQFPNYPVAVALLKWARFVVGPVVAMGILLGIQVKSNRGMRQALGEDEATPPAEAPT